MARLEVDDVAEQDLSFVELVAPDDDRLERQWALAQAGIHCLATGLDALGDRDLALARKQVHRAHSRADTCAPGHRYAPRGPWCRPWPATSAASEPARSRLPASSSGSSDAALLLCFSLLVLDDVDAHLVEHGQQILDLLELTSSEGSTALICSW